MAQPQWTTFRVDHLCQLSENWHLDKTTFNNGNLRHATKQQMCDFLTNLHFNPMALGISPTTSPTTLQPKSTSKWMTRRTSWIFFSNIPADLHVSSIYTSVSLLAMLRTCHLLTNKHWIPMLTLRGNFSMCCKSIILTS